MADEFAEHLLVSSLAHMCKQQGWHQASRSGLSLFSDIAQHYIRNIGILTLRYSLHGGRYEPDLDDLGNAFSDLGIRLTDLQSMWSETEPNRGLPQVCSFPSQPTINFNFPEACLGHGQPDYIPDYLPSVTLKQESPVKDEEKVVKEETTAVLNESTVETTVDPFDEAAAAPTPSAPNFPFVNKTDLPPPVMSSWGFQRVTIDTAPSKIQNSASSKTEKHSRSSPDNFHITENSDDFVFASKHSKAKEEKSKENQAKEAKSKEDKSREENSNEKCVEPNEKVSNNDTGAIQNDTLGTSKSSGDSSTLVEMDSISTIPPETVKLTNHVEKKTSSKESDLNDSLFLPSMGTSTPLVNSEKLPSIKNGENGVNCQQKLFNHSPKPVKNHSSVIEDGIVSKVAPKSDTAVNKKPEVMNTNNVHDSDSEDFDNDFGFGGSSSDEMTSKENFERLLKPLSPLEDPPTHGVSNLNKSPKSPPSKRRKLDSPSSPSLLNTEKNLLKNRPDLIKNDTVSKPKPECKLLNNHTSVTKKPGKTDKNHRHKNAENQKYANLLKKSLNHGTSVKKHEKSKSAKLKKKEVAKSIDLFDDRPIKIPNSKTDKPKKNSERSEPFVVNKALENSTTPNVSAIEPTKLKIAPITLSIPKKEKEPIPKKDPPSKPATPPIVNSEKSTPLKISLKNVKSSKIKSKSTIDSEDDLSSLSSDSLDGFEELLPKKSQKVKKASDSKSDKRTFKTKAELKNPWPPSDPSPASGKKSEQPMVNSVPAIETERKKQKSGGLTTKIKIGKSGVSQSSAVSITSPKPSMKLKLNIPSSSESVDHNNSVYSQPSLRIDETSFENEAEKPPIASLKIPKIKIKIGGSSLKSPDSPASFSSSTINSPEAAPNPKPIKPLKIKLPDPGSLSIKTEPVVPKSPALTIKKEKKEKKVKKAKTEPKIKEPKLKPEPKFSKSKEKVVPKEKPVDLVIKSEPVPEPFDTPVTPLLESSLVSETVVSETVAQTGGDTIKIWYCPSCMLPDDGSPMVGCDKCDEWYHWPCVGLAQAPPDDLDWFCPPCKKLLNKPAKGRKPGGKRKRKT